MQRFCFEEIKAVAEVNDCSDNRLVLNSGFTQVGILFQVLGVLECSLRVTFPEIDAMTKPVIVIFTTFKIVFASQNPFCDIFIAAMESEDKIGK